MKKVIFLVVFWVVNNIVYSQQLMDNDITHSIYPDKITLNEKIVGLSKLWSEIKYNFVNIDQITFDVDSLYAECLKQVVDSKNDIEYYDKLGLFIAQFNDSHTEVYSPYRWNDYNDYIPMIFKEYDNGIYLVSIRKEYELFYLYKAYKTGVGDTIRIKPDFPRIKVPVVILINENCASACEDFLVNIYEVSDRPLIIGTETAGTTGAPLVINMPNGGMARICTLRITYPYSGKPFIKKGISPDIEIYNSLDDDLFGYDRALEAAIKHLRKVSI